MVTGLGDLPHYTRSEPSPRSYLHFEEMAREAGDGEEEENEKVREDDGQEEEEEEEEEGEEEDGEDREEEVELTEYEKQRLQTIERNKAMLASLQLPDLATSLANGTRTGSAPKAKGGGSRRRSTRLQVKPSAVDDDGSGSGSETDSLSPNKRKRKDQEYEPSDDEGSLSESEEEMDEHEEEVLQEDDEEYALQQALALSMEGEATDSPSSSKKKKKRSPAKKRRHQCLQRSILLMSSRMIRNQSPQRGKRRKRIRNWVTNAISLREKSMHYFPSLMKGAGGVFTLRDLERVSTTHDFTWSAEELLDMIHLFNRNNTGALDSVDFRNVAARCNLIISER